MPEDSSTIPVKTEDRNGIFCSSNCGIENAVTKKQICSIVLPLSAMDSTKAEVADIGSRFAIWVLGSVCLSAVSRPHRKLAAM